MSSKYARPAGPQPRPPICRAPPAKIALWRPPTRLSIYAEWRGVDAHLQPFVYEDTFALFRTTATGTPSYYGDSTWMGRGLVARLYALGDIYRWELFLSARRAGMEVGLAYGNWSTQRPHPYDSGRQILYPGILPDTTTAATVTL